MKITATGPSTCIACGDEIPQGAQAQWLPRTDRIYHLDCWADEDYILTPAETRYELGALCDTYAVRIMGIYDSLRSLPQDTLADGRGIPAVAL